MLRNISFPSTTLVIFAIRLYTYYLYIVKKGDWDQRHFPSGPQFSGGWCSFFISNTSLQSSSCHGFLSTSLLIYIYGLLKTIVDEKHRILGTLDRSNIKTQIIYFWIICMHTFFIFRKCFSQWLYIYIRVNIDVYL